MNRARSTEFGKLFGSFLFTVSLIVVPNWMPEDGGTAWAACNARVAVKVWDRHWGPKDGDDVYNLHGSIGPWAPKKRTDGNGIAVFTFDSSGDKKFQVWNAFLQRRMEARVYSSCGETSYVVLEVDDERENWRWHKRLSRSEFRQYTYERASENCRKEAGYGNC